MNLDGYQTHLFSPWGGMGDFRGEPPIINWCHGWPGSFMVRHSNYSVKEGKGKRPSGPVSGPFAAYNRWPIDNAPVAAFSAKTFAIDILILASLIFGTAYGLRGRRLPKLRFSINSLLLLTSIVAVAVTFEAWRMTPRFWMEALAFGILVVAAILTILSVCFSTRRLFARRNPDDGPSHLA